MDETPMALLPVHVYSPRSDAVTSLMFSMVRYGKAPLMVAVVICNDCFHMVTMVIYEEMIRVFYHNSHLIISTDRQTDR